MTILKLAGINNLRQIPCLTDPDHRDVKLILIMYSLESFLFFRLNESSRLQDTSAIQTLGPFAVALTKIINNIQQKRNDSIKGPFTCYSGMALPKSLVENWKTKMFLNIDGYRSTSLDYNIARHFAHAGEEDEKVEVILKIRMENKYGKYFMCLNTEEYSIYPDEQEVLLQSGLIAKVEGVEFS